MRFSSTRIRSVWRSPIPLVQGLRPHLGEVLRRLVEQKERWVEEGPLLADDVHMLLSIPPKYTAASVVVIQEGQERDSSGPGLDVQPGEGRPASGPGEQVEVTGHR